METLTRIGLRKAPYTEFKRVSTSLYKFTCIESTPIFMRYNVPVMYTDLKETDSSAS